MTNKAKLFVAAGILLAIIVSGFWYWHSHSNEISDSAMLAVPAVPCEESTSTTDCISPPSAIAVTPPVAASSGNVTQSGKIDEHLTINNSPRDINFCGNTYRVKQVFIDGVDVAQRIAELATTKQIVEKGSGRELSEAVCWNVIHNVPAENMNDHAIRGELDITTESYINHVGHKTYVVTIANSGFEIDVATHAIYIRSAIGDAPTPIIQKLK